jgi:non-ribosomal peptide synthetase component F
MRVATRSVKLSPELVNGLKEVARTAVVPLKTVLLAAHLRVLSVLSGSNDVLTGIVSHGRPETDDGERVLGLFLNTLPFRGKLLGGTWLDLVQQTFQAEREQLPFRRYPMARIQQDIGSDTSLFEVIFNFVHFHVYEELQNVSDLEVLDHLGVADTNYTLAVDFSLESEGSQISLELKYDAGQLNDSQIEAAVRYYRTCLETMAHAPTARYEQACLLSPQEQQRILYEWNDAAPSDHYGERYISLFEAQVARTPQARAAVLDQAEVSYAELTGARINLPIIYKRWEWARMFQ